MTLPLRIIVVEDEPLIALGLQMILEDAGHCVVGLAATMAEALRIAASEAVDLATMDINLAGADSGIETALRLRAAFGIPSLFVSASLDARMIETIRPSAPVGVISKPFGEQDVLAALDAFAIARARRDG